MPDITFDASGRQYGKTEAMKIWKSEQELPSDEVAEIDLAAFNSLTKLPENVTMDLSKEPPRTVIFEKRSDGTLITHDVGKMTAEELKLLVSQITDEAEKFLGSASSALNLSNGVELLNAVSKDMYKPLKRPRRRGQAKQPSHKKVWNQKRSKRKQQAASRKNNRP